jgi:hypothetical protein
VGIARHCTPTSREGKRWAICPRGRRPRWRRLSPSTSSRRRPRSTRSSAYMT